MARLERKTVGHHRTDGLLFDSGNDQKTNRFAPKASKSFEPFAHPPMILRVLDSRPLGEEIACRGVDEETSNDKKTCKLCHTKMIHATTNRYVILLSASQKQPISTLALAHFSKIKLKIYVLLHFEFASEA